MRTRWPVMVMFALLWACGGKALPPAPAAPADASGCPTGAERCACTAGGACDPGLICLSALCVRPIPEMARPLIDAAAASPDLAPTPDGQAPPDVPGDLPVAPPEAGLPDARTGVPPDLALPPATCEAPPAPLRRLTALELRNTIRDLAGSTEPGAVAFPPEVSHEGFENRAAVQFASLPLLRAIESLASTTAGQGRLDLLLPCQPAVASERPCMQTFIERFGLRALRRPLDDGEKARYLALYDERRGAGDFASALRAVLSAFLQAPAFVYRIERGREPAAPGRAGLSAHETAARLSYFLWGTMPDAALFARAERGRTISRDDAGAEARRMLTSPHARQAVHEFHRQWLEWDDLASAMASTELQVAMLEEARRFVDEVYFLGVQPRTVKSLLSARWSFLDRTLRTHYGISGSAGTSFLRVDSPRSRGILTQGIFLAGQSIGERTSPTRRGRLLRERLLCQPVPPGPNGAPALDPGRGTVRRALEIATGADPSCAACHKLMDPLGFAFEHHDHLGRYRDIEQGFPVDSTGSVVLEEGEIKFSDARELADVLASRPQIAGCVARQWLAYADGRELPAADACRVKALTAAWGTAGELPELLAAIASSEDFVSRATPDPDPTPPPSLPALPAPTDGRRAVLRFLQAEYGLAAGEVDRAYRNRLLEHRVLLRALELDP